MTKTFLIEIETEELPPTSLKNIITSFYEKMIYKLKKNNIKYKEIKWYATPRRLAIIVKNIFICTKTENFKIKGPSIKNAFDQFNNPTNATQCWMKKLKIKINQTIKLKTNQGEWIAYKKNIKYKSIKVTLSKICDEAIKEMSIPIFMRWNENNIQFSRPVRNVVMLLEDKVIKHKILGINTNNLLSGHVFMTSKKIKIHHANQYLSLLEQGKVIADYNIRKNKIKNDSQLKVEHINGSLKISNSLLDEVTSLVEWPKILIGSFNKKFLNLPNEILIHIMEKKQRCFPIYKRNHKKLLNFFIIIANIETYCFKKIIHDHEKVIDAHFSDAEYFFKIDRKMKLKDYQPLLKKIIFENSLGTMLDKTYRIIKLISWISKTTHVDVKNCTHAAHLSKCDLMTRMVFEFPEIQGIMGMHYAWNDLKCKEIAIAIKEHYQPKFSGDKLPSNSISCSLALADKIDTLVGLFYIKKNNNISNKDPYSLRRLAIGIIRIILDKNINIDLKLLLEKSLNTYQINDKNNLIIKNIMQFLFNKLNSIYINKNYNDDIIKSVLICNFTKLTNINQKIQAISDLLKNFKQDFNKLILVYKRITNILKQHNEKLFEKIEKKLIYQIQENNLINGLNYILKKYYDPCSKEEYISMLLKLSRLNQYINDFFTKITINDSNIKIKINRLTILKKIQNLFLSIADFSCLYSNISKNN